MRDEVGEDANEEPNEVVVTVEEVVEVQVLVAVGKDPQPGDPPPPPPTSPGDKHPRPV